MCRKKSIHFHYQVIVLGDVSLVPVNVTDKAMITSPDFSSLTVFNKTKAQWHKSIAKTNSGIINNKVLFWRIKNSKSYGTLNFFRCLQENGYLNLKLKQKFTYFYSSNQTSSAWQTIEHWKMRMKLHLKLFESKNLTNFN